MLRIGLIGDYDPTVPAHRAIPIALSQASDDISVTWLPTDEITGDLRDYDGLWCVPACPYRSMEGALTAIRYARENRVPFLGSCGGFQHALIEHARNVLGWADADHAETSPDAARAVISPLACALVETANTIHLVPGSKIAQAFGKTDITEEYHCRYGLNPAFEAELTHGDLRISGRDDTGEVRSIEYQNHPFFIGTLFQSERAALVGTCPPLVTAFVSAVAGAKP